MPERFVSVREAAETLHLSQSDVRRRVKRGELKAEVLTRPQGTLLRVLVDVPDADQAGATPKPEDVSDTRQDVSDRQLELTRIAFTALTDTLQRAEAKNAQLHTRITELEREAGRLGAERDATLAEVERLRRRRWWRWWN